MADSPLESGPVVGTGLKEDIATGYQKLGNVVQEPFKPGVTGDMVYQQQMDRGRAITALADGISQGFAPFIDKLASNYKDQNAEASTQAGLAAGSAAGANVSGASTVPGAPGQPPAAGSTPSPTTTTAPEQPAAGQPNSGSQIARGADGNSTVLPSFNSLFGGGLGVDKNYTHAVGVGAAATAGLQIDQDLNAMRLKYQGDPEAFRNGASAYLGNLQLSSVPNGAQIKIGGMKSASEYYNQMVTQKAAQDVKASGVAVDAQIGRLTDDTNALLRNGAGVDAPEVAGKIAQIHTLYSNYAANPAFGVPRSQLDEWLHQKDLQFQGMAMVGQVDREYHANGATAASNLVRSWAENSTLPDKDRADITRQGAARIQYNQGQNADAVAQNGIALKGLQQMGEKGIPAPQGAWEGLRDRATQSGDTDTAQQAQAHIQLAGQHPAVLGQSPAQAQAADGVAGYRDNLGTGTGGGLGSVSTPSNLPQSFYDRVHAIENPNNVRAANSAGATGKYQFIPSTWAQYGGGGDIHSDAAQEGAMRRLTADNFQSMQGRIGRDPTQAELYLAHQQGAAGAVKLIENPGVRAGDLVGNAAIRQNGGNPNAPASAFVSHWEQKFDGTTPKATGGQTAAPSANGVPFTAEQLRENPYLAAESVRLAAADKTVRTKQFNILDEGINNAVKNNMEPPQTAVAQYIQLGKDNPDVEEKFQKTVTNLAAFDQTRSDIGPAGGGGAIGGLIDQARAQAANSPDITQQGFAIARMKQLEGWQDALKKDPVGAAASAGWITHAPPPINFTDPNSIAQGLQANARITSSVSSREPSVSPTAIPENQKPQVEAALVSADPQQAVGVLNAIAALPKDARDATIKDMSKAIVGATKSGDPVRMGAAYSLMDQEYRENPMTFDGKFGDGALSDLRKWQEIGQFQTTEKIAKDAMTADDPSTIKARDALKEYAKDKILNTITGTNVLNSLAGTSTTANPQSGFINRYFGSDYTPMSDASGLVLGALKYDYDQRYKEQYANTANADAAEKYALERVGIKWGQSDANGGRFMAYPPERSQELPAIGGDKSWIGKQLGADVYAIHPDGKEAFLVPDQQTQSEMTSGKIPSYQVVTRGTDGSLYMLPKRWAPDPARAQAENAARYNSPADFQGQPQPPAPWATGVSD